MKQSAINVNETDVQNHASPSLQRACDCGASKGVEDQCPACAAKARLGVQPKLTVNRPGDRFEQEADRIADRVVSAAPAGPVGTKGPGVQRMAEEEDELQMKPAILQRMAEEEDELQMKPDGLQRMEEEEDKLQMKSAGGSPTNTAVTQAAAAVSGGGQPMSKAERSFFEPRLGRDLSDVRLHDNAQAGAAAQGIKARAYTLKNHIAFAPGTRDFASTEGRRLMAHELVHTVQQSHAGNQKIRRAVESSTGAECGENAREAGRIAHLQIQKEWPELNQGGEPEIPFGAFGNRKEPCAGGHHGYADLWHREGNFVEIGEIKPDSESALAKGYLQVQNYVDRSNESVSRIIGSGICGHQDPHPKDLEFDTLRLGGMVQSFRIWPDFQVMSGAYFPEIPVPIGPFDGDPEKELWVDDTGDGVIRYWCESDDEKRKGKSAKRAAQAKRSSDSDDKADRGADKKRARAAKFVDPPQRGYEIFFPRDKQPPVITGIEDGSGTEVVFMIPADFFRLFNSAYEGTKGNPEGPPSIAPGEFSTVMLYRTLALVGVAATTLSAALAMGAAAGAAQSVAMAELEAIYVNVDLAFAAANSGAYAGGAPAAANIAKYSGKSAIAAAFIAISLQHREAKAETLARVEKALSSHLDISIVLLSELGEEARTELGDVHTLTGDLDYAIIAKAVY